MNINLQWLKQNPRGREEYHLQSPENSDLLASIGGKFITPIYVDLVVENTGCGFNGCGSLHTMLQLPCSRCLKEFIYPLDIADFNVTITDKAEQDRDGEEECIYLQSGQADLLPFMEEMVITELPLIPLCKPDCLGICAFCGTDRNITPCSCADQEIDPRWEKLKYLK